MGNTMPRPATTAAIRQAATRGNGSNPAASCRNCGEQGLAILSVAPTAVPVALRGKLRVTALELHYLGSQRRQHE